VEINCRVKTSHNVNASELFSGNEISRPRFEGGAIIQGMKLLEKLKPFDRKTGNLNVVIETPKGCRNKYAFDFELKSYKLKTVLPEGAVFPFDFGSIPGTVAEDGDPLDVLLLMDEPAFTGCLVQGRVLGVIEAEQTEKGKTERNDRLIAVAAESHTHASLHSLLKLEPKLVDEIEHFFVSYNKARGKEFKPIGRKGPVSATRLIERHKKRNRKKKN
jgi:inorganic pyrophosphatase